MSYKKRLLYFLFYLFCFPAYSTHILFVEPNDHYTPVLNEIRAAKHRLDMVMYILKDYRIINALIAAEKRGVNVRVILEKKPYHTTHYHPTSMRRKLERAGIQVKWSNSNFFYLTHEKAFDVDLKHLIIMTLNQTYAAFHFNREYGVIDLTPSDILEFSKTFDADWNGLPATVSSENLLWSPNNSKEKLIHFIKTAKHSISIESETFSDEAIKQLLFQKAHQGITVHIILPNEQNVCNLQAWQRNNINIRLLPKKPLYLHAKLIIVDNNKAYLGSENLTRTSLEMNRELGTFVYSDNNLQRLSRLFVTDWKHSKPFRFSMTCL